MGTSVPTLGGTLLDAPSLQRRGGELGAEIDAGYAGASSRLVRALDGV